MTRIVIVPDDPLRPDVQTVVEAHLGFAHAVTSPGHVHALGAAGLVDPTVTFFAARRGEDVVGIGAIKELEPAHGELKSMHTVESVRGQGVGRAMLAHLVAVAVSRGYERVSLETGAQNAFAPARALYTNMGFQPCGPFGDHTANSHSVYMTLDLVGSGEP